MSMRKQERYSVVTCDYVLNVYEDCDVIDFHAVAVQRRNEEDTNAKT